MARSRVDPDLGDVFLEGCAEVGELVGRQARPGGEGQREEIDVGRRGHADTSR